MNRWLKLLFGLLVFGSLAAGTCTWRFFHPQWEPWVVSQLSAPPPLSFARPTLTTPTLSGTFGERLQPVLPRLRQLAEEWDAYADDERLACIDQTIDLKPLGSSCKRWLLKAEPLLPQLDSALAAELGGPAPAQAQLRCTEPEDASPLWTAGLASAMETALAIKEHRDGDAVEHCLVRVDLHPA